MIKNIKQASLLILLFLLTVSLPAQDQDNFLQSLSEKFRRYCSAFPWEEIYIHTDREIYMAGEEIWLNAYLVDRQSGRLTSESSVAYLEILNSENRPVVQKRIKLEKGSGPGDILLPDTLSSGDYTLRAYTNYMKNFLPSNCYMKDLLIFNALDPSNFKTVSGRVPTNSGPGNHASPVSRPAPGFRFEAGKDNNGNLDLTIVTDRDFRSLNGSRCYLFIQTHGNINYTGSVNLTDDVIHQTIPAEDLTPGINQVALFGRSGSLIGEKYIYTPAKDPGIILSAPDSSGKREKVKVEIWLGEDLKTASGSPALSISVAESSGVIACDINDYMIFGSEYGFLPRLTDNGLPGDLPAAGLEKLLSGIKSNWIDFDSVLSGSYPHVRYEKEGRYHYLSGRLMGKVPGSAEESYLFMSIPGKKAYFQYAKTGNNGDFSFRLPVDNEIRNIVIQPEFAGNSQSIRMESPFSEVYPESVPDSTALSKGIEKRISRQGVNYQIKKIYEMEQEIVRNETPVLSNTRKRFYGKPDVELIMDDYIKLPVMPEVFFELMPGVFMKNRRSVYEITIADPVDKRIYEKPPVLFVDGVVVHDPAVIANLDPEVVEEIDAVKERYLVGDYLFYGLVNVITRKGDFSSNVDLPAYALKMPYRVIEPVKSFISSDYSVEAKRQSRLPDFRTTLFWNPEVKVDNRKATLEFWTSDYDTDYTITVEGVDSDGSKIVSRKKIIIR